ncbi:MAG: DNA/RNA non-specific endonuclease [Bacteroidales bacterium]|nr:DNA/RNA non-specific endonuclease [Bacteroidales bacterium]
MKKILLFAATVLLLAVSCSMDDEVTERSGYSRANKEKTVFFATTESTSSPVTKIYTDENLKVLWNENDYISIFNNANVNDKYMFDGEDGDNSGGFSFEEEGPEPSVPVELDHIYAVYPYSASTQVSVNNNQETITVDLPADQLYREHSFGLGANTMVAVTDGNFLPFKNVCGYLKFRFYGDDVTVKSIVFEGNNGEKIAGHAVITPSASAVPTVAMQSDATGVITLDSPEGVVLGSTSATATEFIFVIPPTTFSNGFKVTVTDNIGRVFEKSSANSLTISRSKMESMSAMKVIPTVPPTPTVTYTLVETQSGLLDGTYIIAASGYERAMGGLNGTIHTSETITKTNNDKKIELDNTSSVLPVKITKTGNTWTIQNNKSDDSNYGKYLAWSSGNTSIEQTASYAWNISISNGVATITSSATSTRSLQYNANSPRFCCYESTQKPVALYLAEGGTTPVTGPVINLTSSNPHVVSKSGGSQTATYTISNPVSGVSLSAASNASWITNVTVSSSAITFNVAAQASGANSRTGKITLSYTGASSLDLTVIQEAGEGGSQAANGWLELPATTTGSDYFSGTLKAGNARNYTYLYQYSTYTSLWTAYPLYSATMGSSTVNLGPYYPSVSSEEVNTKGTTWAANPQIDKDKQINVWSGSYGVSVTNPPYVSDIYARGHQIPNSDRSSNGTMQSQTYYATNSTPQIQNRFNGYIWNQLEQAVRGCVSDTVYVVTGATFHKVGGSETITYIKPAHDSRSVPVPYYYWKVLLKVKRSGSTITSASAIGFWFEHKQYSNNDFTPYAVSVDKIEEYTGFDFFVNLPSNLETTAEANTSWTTFKNF